MGEAINKICDLRRYRWHRGKVVGHRTLVKVARWDLIVNLVTGEERGQVANQICERREL